MLPDDNAPPPEREIVAPSENQTVDTSRTDGEGDGATCAPCIDPEQPEVSEDRKPFDSPPPCQKLPDDNAPPELEITASPEIQTEDTSRTDGEAKGATSAPPDTESELPEVTEINPRPFYRQPACRNKRVRGRKWELLLQRREVRSGLVCLLMGGTGGYLLGLKHQSSPSESGQFKNGTGSSSATLSQEDLVDLQGGSFTMGDKLDGLKDAPPHQVTVSPFKMAKKEVTLELWERVVAWGRAHGYGDLPTGNGKADNHPVFGIAWGDAVKWCNALSEKEGLTPCYYTGASKETVVRQGIADIGNHSVNWQANGYRLPTEAEWEFAARGGLEGQRFPWGDEITHAQANYHGSTAISYDKSQTTGLAAGLAGGPSATAAIGSFPPNPFGLYDMAGNLAEWCWDFYDPSYGAPGAVVTDPHGPDTGASCVVRGGSWRHTAADARCASRLGLPGDLPTPYVGFRVVRGP